MFRRYLSILPGTRIRRLIYLIRRCYLCVIEPSYLSPRVVRGAPQNSSGGLRATLGYLGLTTSVLSSMCQGCLRAVRVFYGLPSFVYRLSNGLPYEERSSGLYLIA